MQQCSAFAHWFGLNARGVCIGVVFRAPEMIIFATILIKILLYADKFFATEGGKNPHIMPYD